MDDPLVMGGRESGADLPGDIERLLARQTPDALEEQREGLAVHVLHGQEVGAVVLADVPHPADVGVRDLASRAHLAEQPLDKPGIALE